MTIDCDDVLAALLLGGTRDPSVEAHLGACARCGAESARVAALARALAADRAPEPAPGLSTRVLRAAEPLLARQARHAAWPVVARALAAALVPLPLVLFLDLHLGRAAYELLGAVLPRALTLYVVSSWAATLTILLALTYAAIPILAERQVHPRSVHG